MEWIENEGGYLTLSSGTLSFSVYEWRGLGWVGRGHVYSTSLVSVGPFPTADEAKAAIVAKVREILEKELEALR